MPHASQAPGGAGVRVGVTLAGNDGVTYRLVRDLGGAAQLHRFDAERRAFALVAQTLPEIARFLAATAGVPPRGRFAALLSLAAGDLPSRQPGLGPRSGFPAAAPRKPLGPEEARKKVADLRAELARAAAAEKLQYQLDGLQSRMFKLEEMTRAGERVREGLASSEVALVELQPLAEVADRARGPRRARRRLREGRGEARRGPAASSPASARPSASRPPGRHPSGCARSSGPAPARASSAVAVALAGTASGSAGLRYVALLDVPAFGYAGWVALQWVGDLEGSERAGRRRQRAGDRERKIHEQYDRDTTEVKGVMKALGLETIPDLKEALGRLTDARSVADEWRRRLAEWESNPEQARAAEERKQAERAIGDIEAKLAEESGGFVRDPRQVELEIARIEAEQAAPRAPAAADPAPPPAPAGDPFKVLLEQASAELKASPAGVLRTVQPRLSQILPALSAQRLAGCLADDRGNLLVQAGGRSAPLASLPPADRDLVFLAVKLGLVEQGLANGRTVALVEDAFAGLPEASRRVVGPAPQADGPPAARSSTRRAIPCSARRRTTASSGRRRDGCGRGATGMGRAPASAAAPRRTLAAGWLEARGFAILARNHATRRGEVDLVCREGETSSASSRCAAAPAPATARRWRR